MSDASSVLTRKLLGMPKISLVVPVYNVEEYVGDCLESILGQGFDDIEVIVVNDASTDDSARVIEAAIAGNDKVKFIQLEKNGGLGNARNVGLQHATGTYVMFVDSDDWLDKGTLKLVHDRMESTEADVLVFDYARVNWAGRVRRNARQDLLQKDLPETFDLHDHPDLLTLLMVVWNKAYRRDFIERLGLQFPDGYYEDLPWTYPVLMAAKRISLLDRVCYFYRQRRSGNILGTNSQRHFEVFGQYDLVFAFIDEHPELEEWRPTMCHRMASHLVHVLNKGETRIPAERRQEFFMEAAKACQKHGRNVAWPKDMTLEERLLRRGAYRSFEALRIWERLMGPVAKVRKRVKRRGKRYRSYLYRATYAVARRTPLDPNLAVFASYWYDAVNDNPLAVYRKLQELKPEIRGVWIVNPDAVDKVPAGVDHVVARSFGYWQLLARATYFVNNVNFPGDWKKRDGQVHIQTHHGTTLKTMGLDLKAFPIPAKNMNFAKHMERVDRWDYNLASSEYSMSVWRRANPANYEPLPYGQPRNDLFFTATADDQERMRKELGIPEDKIAVMYAPTFRDWEPDNEVQLDLLRFAEEIGPDYVVMARSHYFRTPAGALAKFKEHGLIDVSPYPDVQPLCLAADILLTDYSSIAFDYAILGRPIVIYAHDWDLYKKLRGVYFELLDEPPGAVARTEEELFEIFRSGAYETPEAQEKLLAYRDRFCEYEDGRAAERVVRRMFLGENVKKLLPTSGPGLPALAPDPLGTVPPARRGQSAAADLRAG